jgi:aminoglycoside 3-N-acetyltransferase I
MFRMMTEVFEEPRQELTDDYVVALLHRADFWVIAAIEGDAVVGGATAHTLPMTRFQGSELFLYDIAVRADRQRLGIGRRLVDHLRDAAAAAGIREVFVPAESDDDHAIEFYRALGGASSAVTFFTFEMGRSTVTPAEPSKGREPG